MDDNSKQLKMNEDMSFNALKPNNTNKELSIMLPKIK